jgi:hypothetical protein
LYGKIDVPFSGIQPQQQPVAAAAAAAAAYSNDALLKYGGDKRR